MVCFCIPEVRRYDRRRNRPCKNSRLELGLTYLHARDPQPEYRSPQRIDIPSPYGEVVDTASERPHTLPIDSVQISSPVCWDRI
jgi:hypothetical protein